MRPGVRYRSALRPILRGRGCQDMKLSSKIEQLQTEQAFEVLARARELEREGRQVIHLQIGEPDFDTPEHICAAACEAIRTGHTHYTPPGGDPDFCAALAEHIKRTRGVNYSPDQIVVVPGGKPILFYGIVALADAGDEVICPDPGYPAYASVAGFVGAKPVPVVLREKNEFRLDVEELLDKITAKTSLIVLNSPHNPTGSVLTKEDLQAIAEVAINSDLAVISDETYESIIYEGEQHSIAAIDGMAERTLITDCFSKSFAMTGWRLGFGACSRRLAEALTKMQINANSCTNSFVQKAGIAALQGPMAALREMVEVFRKRRDTMVAGLNDIPGISCLCPHGAFYAFPNITGTGYGSEELSSKLLDEAGVALLPGTAFGRHGEGYLRISYANSLENIEEALARIRNFLA
jgi:aspartate aminotransferase